MLFDLRGSGRRRTVQVIYAALAILMGGGLIFFGIGGATSGGLVDALNSGGGGSSDSDVFAKRAQSLERRIKVTPRDERLWAELTRARYQDATSGDGLDQASGTFTADGQRKLSLAARSWERYLALDPKPADDQVANLMVQALGPAGLNRLDKATSAMEIVVAARPKVFGLYAQLAQLAYLAGQTRKGDLAAARAVELAPADQRPTVESTLKEAKDQAAAANSGTATTPSATTTAP